ncbi:MAG TPA: hypothetical protein VEQ85_10010, partial [Lacipirellulaceae bacterium]|nr:hypothetical protein [Lacipirellulaceae bacterium]
MTRSQDELLPSRRPRPRCRTARAHLGALLGALAAIAAFAPRPAAAAGDVGYVYAYFKGPWPTGGSSGVFLDYSTDGFNFTPLNFGNPVLTPPQPTGGFPSGENLMRDPSVVYGPDGLFHMVWTTGITTRTIGYASSPDL